MKLKSTPWREARPRATPSRRASRARVLRHRRSHARPSARIGGSSGEAVAKALHAAAFVVDRDEQRGPQRVDLGVQRAQLLGRLVVAREEDDAAGQRMQQSRARGSSASSAGAGDVEHAPGRAAVGIGQATALFDPSLEHDERAREVSLVADREMGPVDALPLQPVLAGSEGTRSGLAAADLHDADALHVTGERNPVPMALENASLAAKRLASKRTGSRMPRSGARATRACSSAHDGAQAARRSAPEPVDPLDGDHVDADAVDHDPCRHCRAPQIGAHGGGQPSSSASAMSAWPIETSSTPGRRCRSAEVLAG